MDQFLIDDLHPVLLLDASPASHPIVQTVEHPDDITGLFDTISYSKVSSFVHILVSVSTQQSETRLFMRLRTSARSHFGIWLRGCTNPYWDQRKESIHV
jgi:aminopeptidase N